VNTDEGIRPQWLEDEECFQVMRYTLKKVLQVAEGYGVAPAHAGTDFIVARDGRIAAVYLFFDKLP
jgi:hypothetical protein